MNSDLIFAIIEGIAATPRKSEKEARLRALVKDPVFASTLLYAYDPFKTYGIRQIPERNSTGANMEFDQSVWAFLDSLVAREVTGNGARTLLKGLLDSLSDQSAELLTRIIRKDLRAGFSESTINKVSKGLIPDFPYMRCSLVKDVTLSEWPWETGVFSQEKADGMFANIDHEIGGLVRITSRQGSEFPIEKFKKIEADVRTRLAWGTQNHGEIVVMRDGEVLERQIGNGILNSVLNGGDFGEGECPVFMIWDQIPLESVVTKGRCATPYAARLSGVIKQLKSNEGDSIELIPTKVVKNLTDALAHYREFLAKGKEGTVIKHPRAIWRDGTSKEQVKLKLEVVVDLKVIGIVPGRVGTKNEGRAGSLTCATSDGELVVDVAVKNEKMRDSIDANPEDWMERITAVRANDLLKPSKNNDRHSLFLPRMVEATYRTDKSEADSLQRVFDQFESAIYA